VTCQDKSLEAPPSFLPFKKYCDITGLEAPYMDPHTRLRYHNKEIYQILRHFSLELTQRYLALRKSEVILK
jgi:INO80 complex subunit C